MEENTESSGTEEQSVETKIKELNPRSKRVDVFAKCLEVGEPKEIPGRFGGSRKVAEATIADETGAIVLSLWDDQIGTVNKEDVLQIKNGYVSLVRGHMRLNVGKYGTLSKGDDGLDEVVTEPNMSDQEHEQPPRRNRGGGRPRDRDRDSGGYGGMRRRF
ncbi:MAG: single-stranded DNA-binding protein [Methanobacteriota archaeon]|nr:MAG: single-stranded DNA-binding protein [Euryarchaeota archaeon]